MFESKVMPYCDICNLNNTTKPNAVIQGRVIIKSNLLQTRYKTAYFWCIIKDLAGNSKINETKETQKEPSEVKIMFWDPFGKTMFEKIKTGKVYDFAGLKITKPSKKYHKHSYQLTMTKNTVIKEKQHLNITKKGYLCNQKTKNSDSKLQINLNHYFRCLPKTKYYN